MIKVLFSILSLFISYSAYASITIDESSTQIRDFSIEYFYDESQNMSIDDVADKSFFKKIPSQFALGYKNGNAWFKIEILNKSKSNNFVLGLSEVFWTSFDFYDKTDAGWSVQKNGLSVAVNERSIKKETPSFLINLEPTQTKVVYIKGNTVSSHIGEFSLYTEQEFLRDGRITKLDLYTMYQAILILIFSLVFFMYIKMREKLYFYYLVYVLSFVIWISVQSGQYLMFDISGWKDALHVLGAFFVFFLIVFSKHMLELEKHAPVVKMMFDFSAWVVALCAVAITFDLPYANLFFNVYSSVFFTGLLVVAIRAWLENYFDGARYYLIALAVYMPTMALMTLTYNGLISNQDQMRYAFVLGSFFEILLFTFILIKRYSLKEHISINNVTG